jgi:GNAT superfamily N-acetyltransferase
MAFNCGVQPLNEYFWYRVGQDVCRRVSFCYIAIDDVTDQIAGYYTLAACGVALADLPAEIAKRLPRYPTVPAVRIGGLAVDWRFQGRKLGGALLYDAIERTCRSGIAAYVILVDAKDERAAAFYEHFGFQRFDARERTLFLPISEAIKRQTRDP